MPRKPRTITDEGCTQASLFDDSVTDNSSAADEVPHEDGATMVTFEEGALSLEDVPSSPVEAYRQRIERLRDQHRVLSELIVDTNRSIARIAAKTGSLESGDAHTLMVRLRVLRQQYEAIDAEIKKELKALQALERRLGNVPQGGGAHGGLVKVRHPNRDFFLADLFDYAIKNDGASMEAPIFTLSTKPDLSVWEWRSKDGSKYVKVAPSVLGRATQHDKDVLIYVVSQLVEGLNRGREDAKHRTVRFTVYDFLVTTNRDTSGVGSRVILYQEGAILCSSPGT
jgi:hypothetical protein